MYKLLTEITACRVCEKHLPLGPRPIVSVEKNSRILIIGQAPGTAVHKSGIPWDDKSGSNLREWMGIDNSVFYNPEQIGIIPMGFCYPGRGKSGDLPPRPECAPLWHEKLLNEMPNLKLTLLIGSYAQAYYLKDSKKRTLTKTVQSYAEYLPKYFCLPHPSPRNNIWQARNPWFAQEVLPELKNAIVSALNTKT